MNTLGFKLALGIQGFIMTLDIVEESRYLRHQRALNAQKFVGSSRFRARTFESENLRFEARGVKPRLLSRG
ncbi:hypothetical protein COT48_04325 [Candidatus Woesearchaeota archaeon CG08_land_8_20_14_0_20_47_9]|nr:MAG: hypothetical protein COT48_04325 [Candidatus Woesearchaeota archaeon CG08_land_8_20_14_0_20_47_9]